MSSRNSWPDVGQIVSTRAEVLACPIDTEFVEVGTGAPWSRGRRTWDDTRNDRHLDALVRHLPARIGHIPVQPWQEITDPELRNVEFLRAVLAANRCPAGRSDVTEEALDLLADFAEAQRNDAFQSEAACA